MRQKLGLALAALLSLLPLTAAAQSYPAPLYTYTEPVGVITKPMFSSLAEEMESLQAAIGINFTGIDDHVFDDPSVAGRLTLGTGLTLGAPEDVPIVLPELTANPPSVNGGLWIQSGTLKFRSGGVTKTLIDILQAYQLVEEDGTPLTARTTINFTGAGITCGDSGGETVCNVPAATTFLALTDTPNSYSGGAGRFVRVNGGENALEFDALDAADIPALDVAKITTGVFGLARGGIGVDGTTLTGNRLARLNAGPTALTFSLLADDGSNITLTGGQLRLPVGSFTNPAFRLGATETGLAESGGALYSVVGGGYGPAFGQDFVTIQRNGAAFYLGLLSDVGWIHETTGISVLRSGTTAQTFRLYETYTDGSNYERYSLKTGSDRFELAAETAGSGQDNLSIRLTPSGTGVITLNGEAHAQTPAAADDSTKIATTAYVQDEISGLGAGSAVAIDIDDDGNDTAAADEIAIVNDSGGAFTVVGDKLTIDVANFPAGGGGGGDNVSVNGSGATDANLVDTSEVTWSLDTGATPDEIEAAIAAAITRDAEWDTAAEINAATTDDDFATLTGSQTLTNKTLTTPTIGLFTNATHGHADAASGGTLSAGAVDTITDIASGLKSGSDATLITGTAGTDGNCAEWNADGDLVDSGGTCGGGGGGGSITLDFGDDGGNDSTALSEIATVNDAGGAFTEPSADKLSIDVSKIHAVGVAAKTSSTTLALTEEFVPCDATSGNVTLTLPAASTASGRHFLVKKTTTANSCILDGASSETIDGQLTVTLQVVTSSMEIVSDGTSWHITRHYLPELWSAHTSDFLRTDTTAHYFAPDGNSTVDIDDGDRYMWPGTTMHPVQMSCTLVGGTADNGGGTQSYTFTLRAGVSDTDCTCVVSEANQGCSDSVCSDLTAGFGLQWKVVGAGTPPNRRAQCNLWWRRR